MRGGSRSGQVIAIPHPHRNFELEMAWMSLSLPLPWEHLAATACSVGQRECSPSLRACSSSARDGGYLQKHEPCLQIPFYSSDELCTHCYLPTLMILDVVNAVTQPYRP